MLGLQGVPEAGDQFQVADEAKARHIVEYRQAKQREAALAKTASSGRLTLDQLHEQLRAGEVKELPVVVKADVQGSVEVLNEMLPKLSNDQVKLKVIQASVGAVTETDVILASASNAIIIAFNVRPERKASELAQREGVDIRLHTIIYELLDELRKAVAGLLAPVIKEIYPGPRRSPQHVPREGLGHDRRLLGAGRHHEARRGSARAARQRGDLYRARQFAATVQGRCQRSARGIRMRRGQFRISTT